MFTGTPEELHRLERQAQTIAGRIVTLLDDLDRLGLGASGGQIHTPGGIIRSQPGRGWNVSSR
ncbi:MULTISPECIES: hypothetical protein [unclassified Streptomyces]|uniref:hypothetical protein n=1 Tax=unclassified Streptomyces TaxID=2593676 RepID=UPI002270173A|nr:MULTISPECIES: hypothetical protein [unclassified Streptomyces]MCY0917014.1 hypothetical protein [Streptomyces sp. H27-G5]MCY0959956.1 hypothetical protein [Streptomyces sp. H27-H5]